MCFDVKDRSNPVNTSHFVPSGGVIIMVQSIGFCPKMILATDTNLIDVFEGLPIPPLEMWIAAHESIYKTQAIKAVWDHLTRSIIPLLS